MMNDEEIWKEVPGYEGLYEASTLGRIRSMDHVVEYDKHYGDKVIKATHRFKSRILKSSFASGYLGVLLSVDGKHVDKLVHRLIAETFVPNPEHKPQVDHIDGNRCNNAANNLRWVSPKENIAHSIANGTNVTCRGNNRKISIVEIDSGSQFESMSDAARYYNIPVSSISSSLISSHRVDGHKFEKYYVESSSVTNKESRHD